MVNNEPRNTPKDPPSTVVRGSWFEKQLRGTEDSERAFLIKRGLFLYLLWIISFEILGRYAAILPTHDPTCPLDRRIPLIPIFIWPYVFCYIFVLLPGFVATDWHRVCRGVLSVLIANLTSFVVYLAYPVAFPKPELGTSISERLIWLEYVMDFHPGGNNLPSLHVIFAWLIYFICLKQGLRKSVEYSMFLVALLITVSTLFVKQHILADVVAGIAWAVVSWMAAGFFYLRWQPKDGDAKEAFHEMARRLVPFIVTTVFLMALFAFRR
jgi:membrane-associated phospholipid phosphatase